MPSNWNKGFTKYSHPSVRKISETMKLRKIDNFSGWRIKMRAAGKIKTSYPPLRKNGNLAEFIGVVLGDGHICAYPRSEELRLISNSNNPGFIKRYARFMEKIFNKKPYITPSRFTNSTKIGFYEKFISKRLGISSGARKNLKIIIPKWIFQNKKYVVRYLRGLYEAEGSYCVHLPTSTYKLFFSNKNRSMLNNVFKLLEKLGFHPHMSKKHYSVQLSKKKEVLRAIKLIEFRKY